MDARKWVVLWFKNNTSLSDDEIEQKSNNNYFQEGWIDSFKFISLVSDIESEFGIRFSNEQFQDRAFSTINGLVDLIKRHLDVSK